MSSPLELSLAETQEVIEGLENAVYFVGPTQKVADRLLSSLVIYRARSFTESLTVPDFPSLTGIRQRIARTAIFYNRRAQEPPFARILPAGPEPPPTGP